MPADHTLVDFVSIAELFQEEKRTRAGRLLRSALARSKPAEVPWFRLLVGLVNEASGDGEVLAEIAVGLYQDGCAAGITARFSKGARGVAKVVRGADGGAVGGRVRADGGHVIVRMPYIQVGESDHVMLSGVESLQ